MEDILEAKAVFITIMMISASSISLVLLIIRLILVEGFIRVSLEKQKKERNLEPERDNHRNYYQQGVCAKTGML